MLKIFLSILSLRPFSRIWGRIVRLRRPRFLVKKIIARYQDAYSIDMTEYQGEPGDYNSLCDFFTRPLDPQARPLVPVENAIVSPADGVLTTVETVYQDQAAQVKGKTYAVSELIGQSIDFSEGWHVAVIYLSPANYHRYHYPVGGTVERYLHTGARLFPVNPMGLNHIDRLFIRNERIITDIRTDINGTPMSCYVAAVGATFVGSIKMEFINKREKRHQWIPVNQQAGQLDEMGRFEMGSTIVMVLPEKMATPIAETIGQPVRVGQPIFLL